MTTARTVVVRGLTYNVIDEPRLNGETAPHLYRRGVSDYTFAGVVVELPDGRTWISGAPATWMASDIRSAVDQILATLATYGAYCRTAGAIVPLYPPDPCDWCGHQHTATDRWTGQEWVEIRSTP